MANGNNINDNGGAAVFCGLLILIVLLIIVVSLSKRKSKKGVVLRAGMSPTTPQPQDYLQPPLNEVMPPPSEIGIPEQTVEIHPPPEESVHAGSYQFNCPDCGTVIYIDPSVKKVKCPKCSHTFRIKKD